MIYLRAFRSWFVERLNPMNWICWMIGFEGLFPYSSHLYEQKMYRDMPRIEDMR